MERRTITTSFGPIRLTGNFRDKPKVLAINGLYAARDEFSRLPVALDPDFDGLVAFIPGDCEPALSELSVAALARAFDEVVDGLGPTVVMGHSIGGLIALAMRSAAIRAVLALDPPFLTSKLWPVLSELTDRFGGPDEALVGALLGLTPAGMEERDYRPFLASLHRPTHVVVGDDPLFPERPLTRQPSFVDEPERRLLADHPMVTLHVGRNSGHKVQFHAADLVFSVLMDLCRTTL